MVSFLVSQPECVERSTFRIVPMSFYFNLLSFLICLSLSNFIIFPYILSFSVLPNIQYIEYLLIVHRLINISILLIFLPFHNLLKQRMSNLIYSKFYAVSSLILFASLIVFNQFLLNLSLLFLLFLIFYLLV